MNRIRFGGNFKFERSSLQNHLIFYYFNYEFQFKIGKRDVESGFMLLNRLFENSHFLSEAFYRNFSLINFWSCSEDDLHWLCSSEKPISIKRQLLFCLEKEKKMAKFNIFGIMMDRFWCFLTFPSFCFANFALASSVFFAIWDRLDQYQ